MGEPGRCGATYSDLSNRSSSPSQLSMHQYSAPSSPPQRVRPRKGVPQRCLQGDCFLDCAPLQKAMAVPLTKQDRAHMQHHPAAYDDPTYAPSHKRRAVGTAQTSYQPGKPTTTRARRRDETPGPSHDSSSEGLEIIANGDAEVGVRRSKRQRRTVAGFEGYNESISLELSADDVVAVEAQAAPVPRPSHIFQSREEALAALAQDVMRTSGVQSFRICLELANDLARYKHPHLPDWPKYTPHVC